MKNKTTLILLSSVLALAASACGDNLESTRPDARRFADAPPGTPDARPVDASIDAMASSTVTVANGACPGTPDHTLTVVNPGGGPEFRLDGTGAANPNINLNAGDTVEFSTGAVHNFASAPGTPAAMVFTTGAPVAGGQMACVTFTAAHATITYQCDMHPTTMNGNLTVN